MRVFHGIREIDKRLRKPVLTVGNFDGLHVGHAAIIETVVGRARALGGETVVYTFDPHPRKVLQAERAPGLLTTTEQKLELLETAGIDAVILEPFTPEFAKTPPETFVRDFLHRSIQPVEVYVGYDFHFGRDREGSMRLLTEMGPKLGFAVTIIPEVMVGDEDVNSTRIRALLEQGEVAVVTGLLGRPYSVRGSVEEGARRGRTLGFPTLNLASENEILPRAGVYAGCVRFLDAGDPPRGTSRFAVTNVGQRPTFEEAGRLVAEAHLLDFEGDAYGRRVELRFDLRLRGEQRFSGPDALREQIARDVALARAHFGIQ